MTRAGVLLTAFGGPDSLDACEPFMRNLMGREPSKDLVARVRGRYEAIGGCSPLPKVASGIADALGEALGDDVPVVAGMRYWDPLIAQALADLAARGVERVIMLSLSPFESKVSSGAYRAAAKEALAGLPGMELVETAHLGGVEGYWDAHAAACGEALSGLGWAGYESPLVLMTAHSLPAEDLDEDDTYVTGLERCASEVAARAELDGKGVAWAFRYQSKGDRPGEWLGPMVEQAVQSAPAQGHDAVAVCPIGFLTDHMETLYDLDIELAGRARAVGLGFARAAVPNAEPAMIAAMSALVEPLL